MHVTPARVSAWRCKSKPVTNLKWLATTNFCGEINRDLHLRPIQPFDPTVVTIAQALYSSASDSDLDSINSHCTLGPHTGLNAETFMALYTATGITVPGHQKLSFGLPADVSSSIDFDLLAKNNNSSPPPLLTYHHRSSHHHYYQPHAAGKCPQAAHPALHK